MAKQAIRFQNFNFLSLASFVGSFKLSSIKSIWFISFCLLFISFQCVAEIETQTALSKEGLLQQAIRMGKTEEVKMLLDEGANPNQPFPDGISPLHVAVINNFPNIVDLLVQAKSHVNATDATTGATPLHLAALYGRVDIAKILIKGGADVDALMKFNISPLLVAAQFKQTQVAELLLNNKANIKHVDQEGFSALHFSAQNGDEITAKILIGHGAPINLKEKAHKATPLQVANQNNHLTMVQLLKENGGQ